MKQEVKEALGRFFGAQKKLNQLGVIGSRDYIGDIARYLCMVMYDMELAGRRAKYDGLIGDIKILVKINNCLIGTPVIFDEPDRYDEAIVVLAPNSKLRPENMQEDFIFYRFTRDEIIERFLTPGGQYIGKKEAFSQGYDKTLSL